MHRKDVCVKVNWKKIAIGVLLGAVVMTLLLGVCAVLVVSGNVREEGCFEFACAAALIGSFVGSFAARGSGMNRFASSGIVSAFYVILRLAVSAFGGGEMFAGSDFAVVAAVVAGGLMAAALKGKKKKMRGSKTRIGQSAKGARL